MTGALRRAKRVSGAAPRAFVAALLVAGCGRGTPAAVVGDGAKSPDAAAVAHAAVPEGALEDLWARARAGDPGDLARLADREGASGLVERGKRDEHDEPDSGVRMTALRAMAFAPEPGAFAGLPFLAEAARGAEETQAAAALESAIDLAARPRRALDPEDAAEMKEGCDAMLALAVDPKGARARRVAAIRALRMLADRGCVDAKAIPSDLDAR